MKETKPLVILGAGGHAKVLIATLKSGPAKILGIVDRDGTGKTRDVLGISVIGDDDCILRYSPQDVELINGVGAVSSTDHRRELFEKFKQLGYRFANVVHASAIISTGVSLGEGAQVMAGAVIQVGTIVCDNTILNTRVSIDHDCLIASHVHVAPGATLSGGICVREGSVVGAGAIVIQGVEIGRQSLVAAGAVVIRNVADNTRVAGVPARTMNMGSHSTQ